jgi:hypothetical protein
MIEGLYTPAPSSAVPKIAPEVNSASDILVIILNSSCLHLHGEVLYFMGPAQVELASLPVCKRRIKIADEDQDP